MRNLSRFAISASSLAMLAAGVMTPVAIAQEDETARLDTITVTAQRREENLQDVPVAVTSFSAAQVEAVQLEETGDLVRFVPGMAGGLNTGTGGAVAFFIRGLGSTEQVPTFDVPVAMYVDEIYLARQSVNNVSLFDVEQVEVLRGPQGTLFGRNSTGGAVSIRLRKPGDEFGGYLEGSYGSFERAIVRGSVDIPLGATVKTKLSGFYVTDDGYGDFPNAGQLNQEETWGIRGAAEIAFGENATWNVAYDLVDSQRTTLGSLAFDPDYLSRTGLQFAECDGGAIDTFLDQQRGNCSAIRTGGVTSNLEWDLGWSTMNFITGWRQTDQDFALDFQIGGGTAGPLGGFMIGNVIDHEQITQEIKFVGETENISWVAGLFYLNETSESEALDSFGLSPAAPLGLLLGHKTLDNETDSIAAYAQADFGITGDIVLTIGGRLTNEEKTIAFGDAQRAAYPAGFIPSFGPANLRPTTANMIANGIPTAQEVTKFNPRMALTYTANEDLLFYVSATSGFKSGGWNARGNSVLVNTPFGPEEAISYEAGMKSEWLDGSLRVNLTAYLLDVNELQLLSGFQTATGIQFVTQNAADLTAHGIEWETAWAPTSNIELFFTGAVSNGGEYENVDPRNGAGGVPCSATPEPANCTTERDRPVRYPEFQANLGGAWTIPLSGMGGDITLAGALSYQSYFWNSSYNDTGFAIGTPFGGTTPVVANLSKTPPTTIVNLSAKYTSPTDVWSAALECANCTEEYYFGSSLAGVGYPNEPRRVSLRLRYNF